MFFGVYHEDVNPEVLEETKRIEEFLTSDKIKGIGPKDVDTKAKIDKLIYELQKEDTDKANKYLTKALVTHFLAMIGTAVAPICIPVGAVSVVVLVVNAIMMLTETKDLNGTELERCAKRLQGRIKKMEDEGCDKKDIEAVKKVLDNVEAADMKNRKDGRVNG